MLLTMRNEIGNRTAPQERQNGDTLQVLSKNGVEFYVLNRMGQRRQKAWRMIDAACGLGEELKCFNDCEGFNNKVCCVEGNFRQIDYNMAKALAKIVPCVVGCRLRFGALGDQDANEVRTILN
ncbi:MAG: hypothetical protein A2Z06_01745 [Candidatus Glassbacteria bacterium RBG_16_58_8]|uniref:Uncharacterized protein n=1 Tax=Candidatus Glassbacteria bacterium RBG_16_58_8 TaxID=1817866 RepID=A0A1F5YC83_9BACT|nr:MAG: hypothetical protein A2Z06_01745 [Candidatus Glassbacteria bacterium RBG_16_58_8]